MDELLEVKGLFMVGYHGGVMIVIVGVESESWSRRLRHTGSPLIELALESPFDRRANPVRGALAELGVSLLPASFSMQRTYSSQQEGAHSLNHSSSLAN
jgi:hypothetical protein